MSSAVIFAAIGQLNKLASRGALRAVSTTPNSYFSDKDSSELNVPTTPVPLRPAKESARWDSSTSSKNRKKHFVDWVKVRVKAGDGGDGRVNMMHRFRIEFAGSKYDQSWPIEWALGCVSLSRFSIRSCRS